MDKQKTITIKINGKDRSDKQGKNNSGDELGKDKEQQTTQTFKVSAWNETAASQETADDHFDYILPESFEEKPVKKAKKPTKTNDRKPSGFRLPAMKKIGTFTGGYFPRIMVNIVLAVVVGLAFGLIILNAVTSDPREGTESTKITETSPSPITDTTAPVSTELPALSSFVVQGGVFSTKASAETAAQLLEAKGIQAQEFSSNGQFVLFLACAASLEEAKAIATEIAGKDVEVFAKPYEVSGATVQGLTDEENKVIKVAPGLFSLLSAGSTSNTDAMNKVETQLAQLKAFDEGKMSNQHIISMKTHLENASTAFLAKQSAKLQTENLAFLAAYQSIGK